MMDDLRDDIRESYADLAEPGEAEHAPQRDLETVVEAQRIFSDKKRWKAVLKLRREQSRAVDTFGGDAA